MDMLEAMGEEGSEGGGEKRRYLGSGSGRAESQGIAEGRSIAMMCVCVCGWDLEVFESDIE